MKKILVTLVFLITNLANASLPNIVALVNEVPITSYEFLMRKKLFMLLNNVQNLDNATNNQINELTIKSLENEQILFQHATSIGVKTTESEIEEAIFTIEERNKKPKGSLSRDLKANGVDISFKEQIRSELIQMNILSYLSKSVTVSPKEIDDAVSISNSKDIKVLAKIFTPLVQDNAASQKLSALKKSLKDCNNIRSSIYEKFSVVSTIEGKLSSLDHKLQSLIKGLEVKDTQIYLDESGQHLILLCEKQIDNFSIEENNYVTNFLMNQKMSRIARKFLHDLRQKANIREMLPD